MADCENLPVCGFFKKYRETKELACRGFIRAYCQGEKQHQCKRLFYKKEHGKPAPDDMLPSGQMMADGGQ